MILIIKPILFAFLKSDSVKKLVVDLLEAYVARTDNKLDDQALEIVKTKLLNINTSRKSDGFNGAKIEISPWN